ncbi:MAG TPA: GNAT family N-acetyltransferase [Gammaproteobacteria bacterium]|nr:GNAT family N-acetyltransferase [Gammaproteobacteria bacterium]
MITIRNAQISDARAIAKVHVLSWQAIYRGHIPDNVLDNLSIDEREKMWKTLLEKNITVLVLENDNNLVGFVSFCPCRDQDVDPLIVAEISAIYIVPDEWRKGFGKLLLKAAISELKKNGFNVTTLWVIENNQQAKKFYEAMGFKNSFEIKILQRDNYTLHEVKYVKDLL